MDPFHAQREPTAPRAGYYDTDVSNEARLPDFLHDPRGMFRRRWPWMLACLVLMVPAAAFLIWTKIQPDYLAKATVLVSSQGIESDFVASPVQDKAFEKISAMAGEALSTRTLVELIEKHGLYPNLRHLVPVTELANVMRNKAEIVAQESIGPQPFYETARVFVVSFRDGSPEVAAAVANDLAEVFASSGVVLRRERIRLARELLQERKDQAVAELELREQELYDFRRKNASNLAGDEDDMAKNIGDLRARLNMQLSRYTDLHPETRALRAEIDGLSDRLSRMHSARNRVTELGRHVEQAEVRVLEVEEKLHDAELAVRLDEASQRGVASILDPAQPPSRPERTRGKFLLVALAGSLGASLLLGLFLEWRDPVVLGIRQLEETFGLKVLGSVGRI